MLLNNEHNKEFSQFFESNYSHVVNACLRYVCREDAEEIVLDAFLKLYEVWERVSSDGMPLSWVFKVAKNGCLNKIEWNGRKKRNKNNEVPGDVIIESVEHDIIKTEILKEVMQRAEKLAPQQKRIFDMVFIQGLQTHEISAKLGNSNKTVLNIKSQLLQKLKLNKFS